MYFIVSYLKKKPSAQVLAYTGVMEKLYALFGNKLSIKTFWGFDKVGFWSYIHTYIK